jgi:hypothetical protein
MTGTLARLGAALLCAMLTACSGGSSSLSLSGNSWPAIRNDNAPPNGDEYLLDPYFGVEAQFGARGFWLNQQSFNLWPGLGGSTSPYFTVDTNGNVATRGSVTLDNGAVFSSGSGAPSGTCAAGSFYTRTDARATAGAEAYVCRLVPGNRKRHEMAGMWHALGGG